MPQFTRFFRVKLNISGISLVWNIWQSPCLLRSEKYTKKVRKFATIKTKICPKGKNSVFSMLKSTPAWKKVVANMSYECRQLMMVFFVSIYQVPDWFWRTFFWHFEAKTNWEPWQLPRWFWLQFTIQLCKCASIISEFVLYEKEFSIVVKC